jgi:large subunit ribosomal protein L20
MTRVKGGTVARARRKKVLEQAKGYFGSKHRLFKTAKEQLLHSGVYAFRDRKNNKRNFRKLWITRINAACRENEISYSKFINGLDKAGLVINRKMLSEIAIDNPTSFADLVSIAKDALEGKEYKPAAVKLEKKATKAETKKEEKVEAKEEVKETKTVKKSAPKKAEAKKETTTKKPAAKKAPAKKTTKKAEK